MKLYSYIFIILVFMMANHVSASESNQSFKIPLQIDVQAVKQFNSEWDQNSLNTLYGRARVPLLYENNEIRSMVYFYFYPSGFGYEALGVPDPEADAEVKTVKMSKTLLYQAFIETKQYPVNVKLGRFEVGGLEGHHYGDYLDGYRTGGFMSGCVAVNGASLTRDNGKTYNIALTFEISDDQFNKGNLRLEGKYNPQHNKGVYATGGWKSNVFDPFQADITPSHTLALLLGYSLGDGMTVFAEGAAQYLTDDDKEAFPVTAGFKIPTGSVIDKIIVEAQFDSDQPNDQVFLPAIYANKKINDYFTCHLGLLNTGASDKFSDNVQLAFRLSGYLNPHMGNILK